MKIENQTLNKSTNHSIITKANKKNFFFFFSCYQSLFFFTFLFPFLFSAFFYTAFLLFLYSSWLTTFKLHPLLCFKSMIPSLSLFIFIVRSCFFLHLIYYIFHVHWGDLLGGWDSFTVRIPPSMSVFEPRKILIFTGWILSQPRLV